MSPFSLLGTLAKAGLPRLRLGGETLQRGVETKTRRTFLNSSQIYGKKHACFSSALVFPVLLILTLGWSHLHRVLQSCAFHLSGLATPQTTW